ncbi:MAG: DUF4855 domain-containing protein [Alicyclobacillus sp.]|nr:DUF4855 domain-containing protein [Alicyclobacillus sp.]
MGRRSSRGAVCLLTAVWAGLTGLGGPIKVQAAPENQQTVSTAAESGDSGLQDLLTNAQISTAVLGPVDASFAASEQHYPQPLTSSSGWHGFLRQVGRQITITFAQPEVVQHLAITMEQDAGSGIFLPDYVRFEVQQNGRWLEWSTSYPALPSSNRRKAVQTFAADAPGGVQAQAVRITFPVAVWVFARGLTVQGHPWQPGETLPPGPLLQPVAEETTTPRYLTPLETGGIHNMLLVATGAHGSQGTWSPSDFLPMIAYVNRLGFPQGSLFDTFLFVPYPGLTDTADGCTTYLNDLFSSSTQLGALNQAVGLWNQQRHSQDVVNVVLNLPYFAFGDRDFGQVNGQDLRFSGTPADPAALQAREAALRWYVSQVWSRWQAAHFDNLRLVGLYWNEEQVQPNAPGERALLQTAEQLTHEHQLPLFWIPYYDANHSTDWKALGFDAAWLQSNYVEEGEQADPERIDGAVALARPHQMGIELELTGLDAANRQLYTSFLQRLQADGWTGAGLSNAVYDGSKLLVEAAQSTDPAVRAVYDATATYLLWR